MKCFREFFVCAILCLGIFSSCKDDTGYPRPTAYWGSIGRPTGLNPAIIHDLMVDKSDNLWAAFYGAGLGRYDGTAWEMFTPMATSDNSSADFVFQDSQGNIWVAVRDGFKYYACKFDGQNWTSKFLSEIAVTGITELKNGNILFAMSFGDAQVFDGTNWSLWDCGGHCVGMETAFVDQSGILWIGKRNNHVIKFDGTAYTELNIPIDNSNSDGDVVHFSQGSSGDIIACVSPGTAWRLKNGSWQRIVKDMSYQSGPADVALEDSQGRVWIGTPHVGVILVEDSNLITYTLNDKKSNITAIVENKNGDIFLGNSYGLFLYKYY